MSMSMYNQSHFSTQPPVFANELNYESGQKLKIRSYRKIIYSSYKIRSQILKDLQFKKHIEYRNLLSYNNTTGRLY